jgi:hypothetical protein
MCPLSGRSGSILRGPELAVKLAMAKVGKSNIIDAPAKRLTDIAD